MRRANNTEIVPRGSINHEFAVLKFMAERERRWDEVRNASSWAKIFYKQLHDLGILKELNFVNGSLVMLYDGISAKK